jgi:hypothetical protein
MDEVEMQLNSLVARSRLNDDMIHIRLGRIWTKEIHAMRWIIDSKIKEQSNFKSVCLKLSLLRLSFHLKKYQIDKGQL